MWALAEERSNTRIGAIMEKKGQGMRYKIRVKINGSEYTRYLQENTTIQRAIDETLDVASFHFIVYVRTKTVCALLKRSR